MSSLTQENRQRGVAEPPTGSPAPHPVRSIVGAISGYFILRIAARASYGILSTFLAKNITGSATIAAVVVTVFFISELGLAPVFGNLSDRYGRRPFLILSPITGAAAVGIFGLIALIPRTNGEMSAFGILGLILVFAAGRLLEGISAACSAPASLGFLADVSGESEARRVRVMAAFEVATVLGVVIGIPIGNLLYQVLGVRGFFGVLVIYIATTLLLLATVVESRNPAYAPPHAEHARFGREAFAAYRSLLRQPRLLAFVPAWLAVNAVLAALLGLMQFLLSLPTRAQGTLGRRQRDADLRFPHQLLVGGFNQQTIAVLLGVFGAMLIVGMVLWTFILPRMQRASAMRIALAGFFGVAIVLAVINRLGENPQTLSDGARRALFVLLPALAVALMVASGFAPAALTYLAVLSEDTPHERGAIMGLYSLLLGGGQLLGTWIGGIFADVAGFHGLVLFSALLTAIAFWSVHASTDHLSDRPHPASGARESVAEP